MLHLYVSNRSIHLDVFFLKSHAAAVPVSQLAFAAVCALNPPLQKDDDATEEEGGREGEGGTAVNLRWWWEVVGGGWEGEEAGGVGGGRLVNATRSEAVSGMKEEGKKKRKKGQRFKQTTDVW